MPPKEARLGGSSGGVARRACPDIHGPKPHKFERLGDIHGPKPFEFIWFGDIRGPTLYLWFVDVSDPINLYGFATSMAPTPYKEP